MEEATGSSNAENWQRKKEIEGMVIQEVQKLFPNQNLDNNNIPELEKEIAVYKIMSSMANVFVSHDELCCARDITNSLIYPDRFATPTTQSGGDGCGVEGIPITSNSAADGRRTDLTLDFVKCTSVEAIKNAIDELVDRKEVYAPFACLLQSSGYGKTRAVLEFAKTKKLVYLPWKIEKPWCVPNVLSNMLRKLKSCQGYESRESKWEKFLTAVQTCAAKYENANDLLEAQITKDGSLGKFYTELEQECKRLDTPPKSPLTRQQQGVKFADIDYDNAVPITEDSLIVCLDEVEALWSEDAQGSELDTAYRCYRRVAKQKGVLSIMVDTFASMMRLAAVNDHSSKPNRLGLYLKPVYDFDTFDVHGLWNHSDDDPVALFSCGRPRWKAILTRNGNNVDALIDTVKMQLYGPEYDESREGLVAYFACRFGFGRSSKLAETLAKNCLATIIHVSDDRKTVHSKYLSEPILAEASSVYTSEPSSRENVINQVEASFSSNCLTPPRGDVGEMMAAALLGFAMDEIRTEKGHQYFTEPVKLRELLAKLVPKEEKKKLSKLCPEKWMVNFSHFVRFPTTPNANQLEYLWRRRLAVYVLDGHVGLDLFISMKSLEGGFSGMNVQIKNEARKITTAPRETILNMLLPKVCVPTLRSKEFSVGLLICVNEVESTMRLKMPDKKKGNERNNKVLQIATSFSAASVAGRPSLWKIANTNRSSTPVDPHLEHGELIRVCCDMDSEEEEQNNEELNAASNEESKKRKERRGECATKVAKKKKNNLTLDTRKGPARKCHQHRLNKEEEQRRANLEMFSKVESFKSFTLAEGFKDVVRVVLPGIWAESMRTSSKKEIMDEITPYLEHVRDIAEKKATNIFSDVDVTDLDKWQILALFVRLDETTHLPKNLS